MSATILVVAISAGQLLLVAAMGLAAMRMLRGPRAQDRVLALDTLYVDAMLLLLVTGIRTGTVFYFEAAFVIAMLGFVTTVALSKFLLRGEIIE
jgi:multicomponent K+:H+ antiporter subunit F